MIQQSVSLFFWLCIIPFCAGLSLTRGLHKSVQNLSMIMVTGYFMMLAIFQSIYLFFVVFYNHFEMLVIVFEVVMILFALISLIVNGKYRLTNRRQKEKVKWSTVILWFVVLLLVGFQCYKTVFFQFLDGDDSFYAVLPVITNTNNRMYVDLPYTGETSDIDKRHAFSSAPIFIAFLSRVCNIHPAIMAHVIFSVVVIVLMYMLYKLVADVLLEKEKAYVPLFLIFINIMNLYGNNTIYTSSTFLLTRTSQGKAFLANIIPAAAILGLLLVWKNLTREEPGRAAAPWILLSGIMITAGYTSITGILFVGLPVGLGVLFLAIAYKKISLLVPCMLAMLPLFVFGLLYLKVLLGL